MSNQSLIAKVASKGALTPLEIVRLQYLERVHLRDAHPDTKRWPNPYLAVEHLSPLIGTHEIKGLLLIRDKEKQNAYDCYQWAANQINNLDTKCAEEGYMGLVLLNDLRCNRSELAIQMLAHDEVRVMDADAGFDVFTTHSLVHNKQMSYWGLLDSLACTYRDLIIIIDIILTLNYYLEEMIDLGELQCLKYLKMWYSHDEDPSMATLDIARICYETISQTIIDTNHSDYIELLQTKVQERGCDLTSHFREDSITYVKETIAQYLEVK